MDVEGIVAGFYRRLLLLLGVKTQSDFFLLSFHLEWLYCGVYVTFGLNKLRGNAHIPVTCHEGLWSGQRSTL